MTRFIGTIVALVSVWMLAPTTQANTTWESRLRKELRRTEESVARLDGAQADASAEIRDRVGALDERLAGLELTRNLIVGESVVEEQGEALELQALSMAVIQIQKRVRKIRQHDSPTAKTPSAKASKKKASPKGKTSAGDEPEWPETLQFSATASLNYESYGEWLYTRMRRSRLGNDFMRTGYEGDFHFSVRLKGLVDEVRSVEFALIVLGRTGPFRMSRPLRYDLRWNARHRHMGNGAKKTWMRYDNWTQDVAATWVSGPGTGKAKPRVIAYATRVVTKAGRVVTFEVPALRR